MVDSAGDGVLLSSQDDGPPSPPFLRSRLRGVPTANSSSLTSFFSPSTLATVIFLRSARSSNRKQLVVLLSARDRGDGAVADAFLAVPDATSDFDNDGEDKFVDRAGEADVILPTELLVFSLDAECLRC